MLAHRAVADKSNEITAIPELLEMLEIEGAIVTIDAIGTQKTIAARIISKKGDYLLALTRLREARFGCEGRTLAAEGACDTQTSGGHGRIEERVCLVADAAWLAERHPQWKGLRSIAQLTATRIDKKTGESSSETRFYISSLPPDPANILTASQAHWSIENNLHWQLDATFREDACRTRKNHAARNLATLRKAVLNLLRCEPSKISLKRKRLKAALNPNFRDAIFAVNVL